ncbi:MAG: TolC family protein [Treponema sp.]|nr:TolC family protein [Treponema sp.]
MLVKIAILLFFCTFTALFSAENNTLTFSQAAEFAVLASSDLRHANEMQAAAEGAWKWGLRSFFPRLSFTVSENDRLQYLGADSFIKNYGISIEQLMFDGGRTIISRKLERMDLDLAFSKLQRMTGDIEESAITAYRNVLSSRAILEIKKSALIVLDEQRRILNEEVILGLALPVDLAGADIKLADAKIEIILLELDIMEIEKQFAEILGFDVLPVLIEKVDINRSIWTDLQNTLFAASAAAAIAKDQNPDLNEIRFSINKKQMELKYLSSSWIPSLRLNGNFGLSGQSYPLTRSNWSVGINIELSGPWIHNRFAAQTGWEPLSFGQYDRTAMIQNSFTPFYDPSARYSKKQVQLVLALEQEKYIVFFERIGRTAFNAVEKCALAEQKRNLALEAAAIGSERCRIEDIRLNLGHITRLKLMEVLIEQTQREIAVVEAAAALLQAERELERLLNLQPGELDNFTNILIERLP